MFAIYKKEMRNYFTTPLGYVFMAVFLAVSGFLFAFSTYQSQTSDISGYFQLMIFGYIVIVPVLTMRSFAEERRSRTEQLLLTAPVSIWGMVFAKFLAAFTVFGGAFALSSFIYYIPLFMYGTPNTAIYFCCVFATLLAGAAFISMGVFISALTENQFIAAFGTMTLMIPFLFASSLNGYINNELVRNILSGISITARYSSFSAGVFDWPALLYYISLCGTFLFLTVRVLEKRRWD
jgi:ABC-2 type transport system permease protein